jgi:hypothetical protein
MSEEGRRKGLYLRCICGIRKGLIQQRRICFLTLTTNSVNGRGLSQEDRMYAVSRDWNAFRTYLQGSRKKGGLGYKFDFISVVTNEGYGVMHVLIVGLPFIWIGRIARMWNQFHGMAFVYITKFKGSAERMSAYLMSQYLSEQDCLFRFKMSKNWICKSFMLYWKIIKNCSRDYCGVPMDCYGTLVYPINRVDLISNFNLWLRYYVFTGVCLDYIPSHYDLDVF